MDNAFKYFKKKLIMTDKKYPYIGRAHLLNCYYDKSEGVVKTTGYTDIE